MSTEMLSMYATELHTRYVNHEISAGEYASAMEDIALIRRG